MTADPKPPTKSKMRILVTGVAGFIGSSVADALLRRGDEVIGVDNFNDFYDPKIKEQNANQVALDAPDGKFRLLRTDFLREHSEIESVFQDSSTRPDVICHLAAYAGVRESIADPHTFQVNNNEGTQLLLETARRHDVKPFVFASSSSVYGARDAVPFRESDRVDDPISPYAATKKAGELMGYTYHHLYDVHFTGLRFFTVYGPRQRPRMAIHLFTRKIIDGEPINIHGDGSSSRDYTFIDDIVDGVLGAIDLTVASPGYRLYIWGRGRRRLLSPGCRHRACRRYPR